MRIERRRQAAQVFRAQRTRVRIIFLGYGVGVIFPEPFHVRARQHVAVVGEFLLRRRRQRAIGDRVEQQLEIDRRTAAIARHHRDYRRQVSARAVAADREPRRVRAERRRVFRHPLRRRVAILRSRRKYVLRRQPVIDRHHHASRLVRERAAYPVVTLEIAEHPSAAVEINQHAHRRIALGRIDARRDVTGRAGDVPILDAIDRRRRNRIRLEQRAHLGPRLLRGLRAQEHRPGRVEHVEHHFHLGIERSRHARSLGDTRPRGKRKSPPIPASQRVPA